MLGRLRHSTVLVASLAIWVAASSGAFGQAESALGDKAWQVLEKNCLTCHVAGNPSGLDLHRRDSILKGGKRGPAAIAGNAESSLLYRAVAHSGELKMPPGTQGPMSQEDLRILRDWINAGLPGPLMPAAANGHWAFQPVKKVAVPDDAPGWAHNEVDRFIFNKLHANGLKPVPPADRRTLLRRAYFDLIGLPPTPAEMLAFLSDNSPQAYAKVVDRLLKSPRYGERWGRHWMDVVHYADTAGDNADYPVPEAPLSGLHHRRLQLG